MPSTSYRQWRTMRAAALGEIAEAHAAVGGTARGRRYTTQQINRAFQYLSWYQMGNNVEGMWNKREPADYPQYVDQLRCKSPDVATEISAFTGIDNVLTWMQRRGLIGTNVDIVGQDEF